MKNRKLIGDRTFYKRLLTVMVPILIQNVITNFVNLLDNVMVGRVGTEPMSGVAIVNQLLFVFNLVIFGGLAGPGIFTAQFYGKGDREGIRHTFRAKLWFAIAATIGAVAVFALLGDNMIKSFLHEGNEGLDLTATFNHAKDYYGVMKYQIPLFALMQVYSSTLREADETRVPMLAGIIAVLVNLVFNYILIFGKFGAPALGVKGAAIATVISRVVECAIIIIWTHSHKERQPFIVGVYSTMKIPRELTMKMIKLGAPLLINEFLWSAGMTTLNQCYSTRGLEVVSAVNISSTVSNLFYCAFFAMGNTIAIMIGQLLGAGELERAVDEDRKLIAFSVFLCTSVGAVMLLFAPLIPQIYNTTESVKALATSLLMVNACFIPVSSFTNACYFTLRSGGKTIITFIFDSAYLWTICVPSAMILSRLTGIPILPMYIIVQSMELIKVVIGFIMVKSKKWVNNLVTDL